jgi:uncharacterized membrane protein
MMWRNHSAWGAGDWLSMSVIMPAFWALVIALILWLVRSSHNDGGENRLTISPMQRADEVLAERFAGDEIDEKSSPAGVRRCTRRSPVRNQAKEATDHAGLPRDDVVHDAWPGPQ